MNPFNMYTTEELQAMSLCLKASDSNYKGNLLAQAVEMLTSIMSRSESEVVDILYVNRHFCQASEHRAKDAIEQAYKAHRETLPKKVKKGMSRLASVKGA